MKGNALIHIQKEAKVIVEQLADKQINEMIARKDEFLAWMQVEGNAIISRYSNQIETYGSVEKYVFLTRHFTWNSELSKFVLPTSYEPGFNGSRRFMNKEEVMLINEIRMMLSANGEANFREQFIASNMMKLNRALAKHIHDNMTASNIKVRVGGDGAEVTADVDGMKFKTFGTLCGGYVQIYHYRYRSSLK